MAFNGAGVFVRLYSWVNDASANIKIRADRMDNEMNGFATGLSTCITKDGQTTITNDIPFSNHKITGLADASGSQDAVNLRTLGNMSQWAGSSAGTATDITLNPTISISAYSAGQRFTFLNTNTSAVNATINISSVGANTLKKSNGNSIVNLAANDLPANNIVDIIYNGTNFQVVNIRPNSQGANIASAGTVNLDNATGDYVHITGTTTITAITLAQGRRVSCVFDGILTITNGASLINVTSANITTAVGDVAVFVGEASGVVRMVSYQRVVGFLTADNFSSQLLHVRDEKAGGTAGGAFTNGAFRTRTLNTVKTNQISGASLASNQVTLPAGTYHVKANAPATQCDEHQAKLVNITDTVDLLLGTSTSSPNSVAGASGYSLVNGVFTISGTKIIELQHRCNTTGTFGVATPAGFGTSSVFAEIMIWKVG